jgi:hypothetical protein
MRSHLVLPILLTASVLGSATMLKVLDRAFALNLRAVLVRTLLVLILVGWNLLDVCFDTVGLRLLLLYDSVNLIVQTLILLEYLVVALDLLLVCVDVLDYVDAAAVELRDVDIGLAATSAVHVLLARRLLLLVNLLLRAVHLQARWITI